MTENTKTIEKPAGRLIPGLLGRLTTPKKSDVAPQPPLLPAKMQAEFHTLLRSGWQQKWFSLEVTHPRLQKLADAAQQFCVNWVDQKPNPGLLYIHGKTGTGKSHVLWKIERYCRGAVFLAAGHLPAGRNKLPSVQSFRWPELANEFRDKNISALPDLFETDLVLLDDVGAEDDPFKVVADKLNQVLSRRERKFTVITSNLSPPDFSAVDPRITDRLMRNAKLVDLAGVPSFAEWRMLNSR